MNKKEASVLIVAVATIPWAVWGMAVAATGDVPTALTIGAIIVTVVTYAFGFMIRLAHQHRQEQEFAHEIMGYRRSADARAATAAALSTLEQSLLGLRRVVESSSSGGHDHLASELECISRTVVSTRTLLDDLSVEESSSTSDRNAHQ